MHLHLQVAVLLTQGALGLQGAYLHMLYKVSQSMCYQSQLRDTYLSDLCRPCYGPIPAREHSWTSELWLTELQRYPQCASSHLPLKKSILNQLGCPQPLVVSERNHRSSKRQKLDGGDKGKKVDRDLKQAEDETEAGAPAGHAGQTEGVSVTGKGTKHWRPSAELPDLPTEANMAYTSQRAGR